MATHCVETMDAPDALDIGRLVDAGVVARALGVAEATVRSMARRGELPAVAVGPRLMRFDLAAVLRSLPPRNGVLALRSAGANGGVG
jgi:excisionase family DNA binding protein